MNPEHKRIVELASGWEDSDALVSLSPADALLLKSVGAPITPGKRPGDPSSIVGRDLYAAGETIRTRFVETPEGAQPTPNQQSVTGPGTDPGLKGPAAPGAPTGPVVPDAGDELDEEAEDLDALTVDELKAVAADERIALPAGAKKAQIVEAIEKARAAK